MHDDAAALLDQLPGGWSIDPRAAALHTVEANFLRLCLYGGMRFVEYINVATAVSHDVVVPESDFAVVQRYRTVDVTRVLFATRTAVIVFTRTHAATTIEVAASSDERLSEVVDQVRERLPSLERENSFILTTTSLRGDTLVRRARRLEAPNWQAIRGMYPAATAHTMDALIASGGAAMARGGLVLLHGPPGTGKTTAIRALARELEPSFHLHLVSDPERLFATADYLNQVLEVAPARTPTHLRHLTPTPERARLLIAEDCDDYLRPSAGNDAGPALGRLLNLSDGLLGQGERTVTVLTTNEPLDRLHPAVVRPGRCIADIEFPPLTRAEASTLLPSDVEVPDSITLAEVFEARGELQRLSNERRTGEVAGYL